MFGYSAVPQFLYRQDAQPAGTIEDGSLWYDTDDNTLYTYDGATWTPVLSNVNDLTIAQAQQAISILKLQANASLSATDYTSMLLDVLSDSTGYDNTIDAGHTTAGYASSAYSNALADVTETDHDRTGESGGTYTSYGGYKITTKAACQLISIRRMTNSTHSTASLLNSSKTPIATATFVGDTATFATPQALADATTYYVALSNGSAIKMQLGAVPGAYPVTTGSTHFNVIKSLQDGTDGEAEWTNIRQIVTRPVPSNLVMQTNAAAVSFDATHYQLYCDKTTAGTGAVTFNISFDGGSTWDGTNKALNTKYATTDSTGRSVVVKVNLNGTGTGNTASITDYCLILWNA